MHVQLTRNRDEEEEGKKKKKKKREKEREKLYQFTVLPRSRNIVIQK